MEALTHIFNQMQAKIIPSFHNLDNKKRKKTENKKEFISFAISPYYPIFVVNWNEYKQFTDKETGKKYREWVEILDHFTFNEFPELKPLYDKYMQERNKI